MTPETHGEKQKAFDRIDEAMRALHDRVEKEGNEVKSPPKPPAASEGEGREGEGAGARARRGTGEREGESKARRHTLLARNEARNDRTPARSWPRRQSPKPQSYGMYGMAKAFVRKTAIWAFVMPASGQ